MDEIRVLVIATTDLGFNGITSVIMNYYRNIDRDKIQFDFIIGEKINEDIAKEIKSFGGKIYKLPSRKKQTLKYLLELRKIIRINGYKIVHAHGNSGTLFLDIHLAKKMGVPVRIAHSHNSTCKHKFIHKILKNKLNKETTHPIACSKLAGDWLFNKEYTIINNGVDIQKFKFNNEIRKEYRDKLNLSNNFVIGHIGHFSYQKNHEYLLEIFKEVYNMNSNARLLLIGDGILRSSIEEKIKNLKLEKVVVLLGKRNDTDKLIQAMDLFVFPSRFEGLPVVLIETQVAGLKSIVSDNITKECKITDKIKYLSLEDDVNVWKNEVLKCNKVYNREDIIDLMDNSQFNIKNEVKKLEDMYLKNI